MKTPKVLISFREWLHSYQGVFDRLGLTWNQVFSSLSESGFIPTLVKEVSVSLTRLGFSSLSESGFIPTCCGTKHWCCNKGLRFSSLSESGFIPTSTDSCAWNINKIECSHLFQRVASFLLMSKKFIINNIESQFSSLSESGFIPTSGI